METRKDIYKIQRLILNWFATNKRDFPWRHTENPLHLLIAEKLLQQTIVRDHVVDAYRNLVNKYPAAKDLADAEINDLTEIFQPLGLTYRATELKEMAKEISENYFNEVPKDIHKLLGLKGVGDYSARAVLSFVYNEDVPIVDTNIARFLHRLFDLGTSIPENPARSKKLREFAEGLLPKGDARDFNFALLDLCAAICKPNNPKCSNCPIQELCEYGKNNLAA